MTVSSPLSLFPAPPSNFPGKLITNLPRSRDNSASPAQLKGVTLRVDAPVASIVQPAPESFKHSLFCDPAGARIDTSSRVHRKPSRSRRRSDNSGKQHRDVGLSPTFENDQVGALPENSHFGSSSPPSRRPSTQLKRPAVPRNISTEAQAGSELSPIERDQLSPLPEKTRFVADSPPTYEYPASLSIRSGSPTLVRSNSAATSTTRFGPDDIVPTRSIFPTYDPTKPLNAQNYYPAARSMDPSMTSEMISKLGSPIERKHALQSLDSTAALVDGYEHIPAADSNDLLAIWKASGGKSRAGARKVRLSLRQPRDQDMSIAISGPSNQLLYSMKNVPAAPKSKDAQAGKTVAISKHCSHEKVSIPFAQVALPKAGLSSSGPSTGNTVIFPQTAAIQAIEAVANSPAAFEISAFDPAGVSPEAARLARDAVTQAHRIHSCELVRTTRKRDSLGAVTAAYNLEHPSQGHFAITITKSSTKGSTTGPKAKICLHHPSATPAAVAAETLVLAFLDFARDACVLDTPGLLALDSPYIIDTAISALLVVAAIENDALKADIVSFPGPPKTPILTDKKSRNASSAKRGRVMFGRSKAVKESKKDQFGGEQVDLPVLTQGALAVLGLSLKATVFLLEAGVKVTASVVIGVSHMVQKA